MKGFGFLGDLESIGWDESLPQGDTGGKHPLSNGVGMKENLVFSEPRSEEQVSEEDLNLIREELCGILAEIVMNGRLHTKLGRLNLPR